MCGLRQDPLLSTEPSHKAVRDPGGYSQGNCQGGELDKSHGSVFILRRRISQLPLLMANGTSQMKQLRCKPCGTVALGYLGYSPLNTKSNSLRCLIQYAISTSPYGSYRKHERNYENGERQRESIKGPNPAE